MVACLSFTMCDGCGATETSLRRVMLSMTVCVVWAMCCVRDDDDDDDDDATMADDRT